MHLLKLPDRKIAIPEPYVRAVLSQVEIALIHYGGASLPFHRNYAAIAIAGGDLPKEERTWENFETIGLWYLVWIGNQEGYENAQRDYMENAKRKCFTSWRIDLLNDVIASEHRHPKDSWWNGATPYHSQNRSTLDLFGTFTVATSAQKPRQDAILSRWTAGLIDDMAMVIVNSTMVQTIDRHPDQPDGHDTIGGESFGHPPMLWWKE